MKVLRSAGPSPVDPGACVRPPGENFNYRLGYGPCDCRGCLYRSAREPSDAHVREAAAECEEW